MLPAHMTFYIIQQIPIPPEEAGVYYGTGASTLIKQFIICDDDLFDGEATTYSATATYQIIKEVYTET